MDKLPLISIVTVSYNQGEFIRDNIESVLAQNYPKIEHIIIDGGSTDSTLSILKEYPHLKWISEPDRGQSHGLNKGFRMAKGEFLGWINSDDYLEPNCLAEVVEGLTQSDVVMGMCEKSDRNGKRLEVNPNVGRSFFDILKYWVMFSTPDQPGVFFRKSALDAVALSPGVYLDEELDYCMDVELWMRLSKKFPFTHRIPKVTSHFRAYEDSKTGANMAAAYRETSRIFARHQATYGSYDRTLSFIIPVNTLSPVIAYTLESLAQQVSQNFEVIFVDYSEDDGVARRIRKAIVLELGETFKHQCVRYVRCYPKLEKKRSYYEAINAGAEAACGPLLMYLEPGATVTSDFALRVDATFRSDPYGMALPLADAPRIQEHLSVRIPAGMRVFNVSALFNAPYLYPNFVIRRIAMRELAGIRHADNEIIPLKELLLRMSHKSWSVSIENDLRVNRERVEYAYPEEAYAVLANYTNATLITEVHEEYLKDPFAETRATHGVRLAFPPELVQACQRLLKQAPLSWQLSYALSEEALRELLRSYPKFGPAHFFLSQRLKQSGRTLEADEAYSRYLTERHAEMQ